MFAIKNIEDLKNLEELPSFKNQVKEVRLQDKMRKQNLLTFRDSNTSFNSNGDLLKTLTIYKFIVDHSNLQDRKKFR